VIAKDCIDYEINFLNSDANVLKAIDWCEKHLSKYAYLIDENKNIIGWINSSLLYEIDENKKTINYIQELNDNILLNEVTHIFDILKKAEGIDTYIMPVVDLKNKIIGFTSANKILKTYSYNNQILLDGGIIILELEPKNYALSEIARIVENNNAVILNTSIHFNNTTKKIEISLKINQTDLKNIQASFERYNYTILKTIHQSEYELQLQDRIDNLLKYLEV
jgi:acetoin utilization protein AcuB